MTHRLQDARDSDLLKNVESWLVSVDPDGDYEDISLPEALTIAAEILARD